MAIFARLVLLLFGILFSAGIGGALAATNGWSPETKQQYGLTGAAVGAVAGIFIGRFLGNVVAGKPPQS